MNTADFIKNIQDLIARDEMAAAMEKLRAFLDNSPKLNEVLQQSGRFAHIRKQLQLGLVSHEEAALTQNQIRMGLLELLSEIETQSSTPALQKEMERAVSIVNSKNVVVGSTISAGGNVHIGDTITQITHSKSTHSSTMKNQRKAIWLTVLIAILGVALGFLGELMPDAVKTEIEEVVSSLGLSFKTTWYAVTGFVVLLFTGLVWKEASKVEPSNETSQGNNVRNVHQHGDKSVYIEKNEGPININ